MNPQATWQSDITPAQLSYLAIYNPTLGLTDETFDQQLVFYYSRTGAEARATQRKNGDINDILREQSNDQLRQIGLAQGLVDFAKTFSDGEPVDSVETEKSRIVLHQLEKGWWILASISLTRLPIAALTAKSSKAVTETTTPQHEYSSREVSTPALLVQQIKQGHSVFTLHHGTSLSSLFTRLGRSRFCSTLDRFWTRFAKTWDVLLHGNPAVDALAGIKLASGGELGFGVGEELWGSGERDVLEDFTRSTEGLVDTIVARYGDQDTGQDSLPWLGAGSVPSVADGIVFGGINAITRQSLQSVSLWMNHIYTYGDHAYGVRDNPSRERRKRRRRNMSEQLTVSGRSGARSSLQRNRSSSRSIQPVSATTDLQTATHDYATAAQAHPGIPPPIVSAAEAALDAATRKAEQAPQPPADVNTTMGIPDQYVKYLTLGLSTWVKPAKPELIRGSTTSSKTLVQDNDQAEDKGAEIQPQGLSVLEPIPDGDAVKSKIKVQKYHERKGHFVIGLKGDLDTVRENDEAELTEGSLQDAAEGYRTIVRTVHVNVNRKLKQDDDDSDETLDASPHSKLTRLRVLIYAHRPFIFCFLFEQRTDSLDYTGLYRSIHKSLSTIHKPLLASTQPSRIAGLIDDAKSSKHVETGEEDVYDLLFDPIRMTVHSSLPNIPEPGSLAAEGILSNARDRTVTSWTRLDSLNVHTAILGILDTTQRHKHDLEKTSRTNRNWWVVWMRLPASDQPLDSSESKDEGGTDPKARTAIIVRKANDAQTAANPSTSSRAASGMWASLALLSGTTDTSPRESAGILPVSGIGFDARKYVEGLLSLNR